MKQLILLLGFCLMSATLLAEVASHSLDAIRPQNDGSVELVFTMDMSGEARRLVIGDRDGMATMVVINYMLTQEIKNQLWHNQLNSRQALRTEIRDWEPVRALLRDAVTRREKFLNHLLKKYKNDPLRQSILKHQKKRIRRHLDRLLNEERTPTLDLLSKTLGWYLAHYSQTLGDTAIQTLGLESDPFFSPQEPQDILIRRLRHTVFGFSDDYGSYFMLPNLRSASRGIQYIQGDFGNLWIRMKELRNTLSGFNVEQPMSTH